MVGRCRLVIVWRMRPPRLKYSFHSSCFAVLTFALTFHLGVFVVTERNQRRREQILRWRNLRTLSTARCIASQTALHTAPWEHSVPLGSRTWECVAQRRLVCSGPLEGADLECPSALAYAPLALPSSTA